ncbi:MAG: translational machinery protein [Proteobacteria bacterium]|nr:translational machinery protein [Pseudomonadota bacterium]
MAGHYHVVVWIDHHEARIITFNTMDSETRVVRPQHPARHLHHKANTIGDGRAASDPAYYGQVAQAIEDCGAILITGPANAKNALRDHIERETPQLVHRIVGIETMDHPTDGELLDHARCYFAAADRMQPQLG